MEAVGRSFQVLEGGGYWKCGCHRRVDYMLRFYLKFLLTPIGAVLAAIVGVVVGSMPNYSAVILNCLDNRLY